MARYNYGTDISDFDAVRLTIASEKDIMDWSHGEVLKPETINYRTQKPERDGLFCEKIFGPVKDINPHDAKYKGMRSREMAVDKKGEIVTKSIVRRERMAHIALAAPVAHIWFLRGTPSAIGLLLGMTVKNLEKVAYFAAYIVTSDDLEKRDQLLADAEAQHAAETTAVKARFEEAAKADDADVKKLAEEQTKELEGVDATLAEKKDMLDRLVKLNLMSEVDYRSLPDDYRSTITVGMGGQALKDLLDAIDLSELIKELSEEAESTKGQRKKKIMKRLKMLEGMQNAGISPESMMMTVLPVIPPDLRPMVQLTGGRFATSDLNDLYRRVINRNNRLKKLIDLNAPEVIRRNEQRMLQEAVDALIDNNNARSGRAVSSTGGRRRLKSLSDMLKGKQGRFRQNLLGKRVDYSGRSVIVSGPELTIEECGLPKMMALELFKPFVMGHLIANDHAHNIKSATRMIESGETVVWDALDNVIEGKYVLLNRAPTLHRLGIQAFQPKLIEGRAIQLHPLVCKGFNADFDGDQMAVHLPLSISAQNEAREIMAANKNLLKPADGSPILHIEQDIVLGCYYLTYDKQGVSDNKPVAFASVEEALMAFDSGRLQLQSQVILDVNQERLTTTLGRVLFNEIFPEDFPFIDEAMTKKKLGSVLARVYAQYGQETTAIIADSLKDLGFHYATLSGLSTGMDDYSDLKNLDQILDKGEENATAISQQYDQGLITDEERYRLTIQAWMDTDKNVLEALEKQFAEEDSATSVTVASGARGNIGQVKQVTGSMGITTDAVGRAIELPIKSNYKSGFTPLEYFTSTKGARKGMIDTALKTADSGYLTRRLVDVSQDIFTVDDDSDDPGFEIFKDETADIGLDFAERITGRVLAKGIKGIAQKGTLLDAERAKAIAEDKDLESVSIMSVLSCSNLRGVSTKSYGADLSTGELVEQYTPVGVIAAQSIGEPGTQLTLRTFHSGGVAGDDITQGLPRVEELFEARMPKGQAFLSEINGMASVWEEGENYIVQIAGDAKKTKTLPLKKGQTVRVKAGQEVAAGDTLASTGTDDKSPLTSPIEGVVELAQKEILVAPKDSPIKRYTIPGNKTIAVSDGEQIEKGQRISSGSINLHELMELQGVESTQRYIMNEVLRIFASQGQTISDKHLEVVVRQMFSRVQIEEPGDSAFVTGDVVSKAAVVEANEALTADKKEPAVYNQLLLGITKVSTWSDSFLSAASFQDTTRVLINAATSGKVDKLYGLKENVILGRMIPVGTGANAETSFDEPDPSEVDV